MPNSGLEKILLYTQKPAKKPQYTQ